MNKKTIRGLAVLLLLGLIQVSYAQTLEQKAQLQMELCDYTAAIRSYEELLSKHPDNKDFPLQLARVYFLNKNYLKSADWFEVAAYHDNLSTEDLSLYHSALRATKKDISNISNQNITSEQYLQYSGTVTKQPLWESTLRNVYNPILSGGKLLFLTDEASNEDIANTRAHYGSLWFYGKNQQKPALNQLNSISNIGAFSKTDKQRCAFASHSSRKSGAIPTACGKGSIFFGNLTNGSIEDIESFPYNGLGISNTDPFISADGNTLIFSSDMPGGYGGMDLYISHFTNGQWSTPVNLGEDVNTPGNEISPMLSGEKLYFASNHHKGFGGYDLFSAQRLEDAWIMVNNLGEEINTPADECYPFINESFLYYSSNFGSRNFQLYMSEIREKLFANSLKDMSYEIKTSLEDKDSSTAMIPSDEIIETPQLISKEDCGDLAIESPSDILDNTQVTSSDISHEELAVNIEHTYQSEGEDESVPPAIIIPDYSLLDNKNIDLALTGIKRVGLAEFIPNNTTVYFIQLASLSSSRANYTIYQNLLKYGNIYKFDIAGSIKIRLGYFMDQMEAEDILAQVRKSGFRDAFIVREPVTTTNMELVLTAQDRLNSTTGVNNNSTNFQYSNPTGNYGATYKVRLASYEDPIWFDNSKVKDLGQIEQWSKGTWTIFILSGYNNFEQANQAKMKAANRGFKDAEVVIDNGGILERLKAN